MTGKHLLSRRFEGSASSWSLRTLGPAKAGRGHVPAVPLWSCYSLSTLPRLLFRPACVHRSQPSQRVSFPLHRRLTCSTPLLCSSQSALHSRGPDLSVLRRAPAWGIPPEGRVVRVQGGRRIEQLRRSAFLMRGKGIGAERAQRAGTAKASEGEARVEQQQRQTGVKKQGRGARRAELRMQAGCCRAVCCQQLGSAPSSQRSIQPQVGRSVAWRPRPGLRAPPGCPRRPTR